ncbi:MAG: phage tail tape measure protein, partial [Clostridia bacterium]|nr:phage tail tape measure protein [Clostridia bacterium]
GAQEVAASKMQGFNGAMQAFRNAMETLLTTVGQRLLPPVTAFIQRLTDLINRFGELPAPVQNVVLGFLGLAAAVGPLLIVLGTLAGSIGNIIELNELLNGKLVALGARFLALAGPVGLVAIAIGAAAYEIIKNWDSIGPFFENLWNGIRQSLANFWAWLRGFLATWGPAILAVLAPFIGVPLLIAQHWEQIRTFIVNLWSSLSSWLKTAAQDVANAVVAAFRWLYEHNYYFQDLVDAIRHAWAVVSSVTSAVWGSIRSWLLGEWSAIRSAAQSVFNAIHSAIGGAWNAVRSVTSSVWNAIASTVSSAWNSLRSAIAGAATSIVAAAEGPFNRIRSFVSGLIQEAYSWGRNLIHSIVRGIESMADSVASAASNVAHAIWRFLGFHSPAEEGPGSEADQWGPNLVRTFAEGIRASAPLVQAAVADLITPVAAAFSQPVGQMILSMPAASLAAAAAPSAAPMPSQPGAPPRPGQVNIVVELDGRTIARAIGQPLVEEIRLRAGARI